MTAQDNAPGLNGPDLTKLANRSARTIYIILAVQGVLLVGALALSATLGVALLGAKHRIDTLTTAQTGVVHRLTAALCDGQREIGEAPVNADMTSRLGVQIVESFRKGFVVLGCPGELPAPSAALLAAGKKWNVPIRY